MAAVSGSTGEGSGKFVCVFNRARDSYQVVVALKEAGLLEVLVTDYYAPDNPPAWLPGVFARKRHAGLSRSKTVGDRIAFVAQYAAQALRLPMRQMWRFVGRRLGKRALRVARDKNAALYCYHHYLPARIEDGRCLIVFVFHPLPQHYLPTLGEDAEVFPEARRSFNEERSRTRSFVPPIPWERADALVCASQVTADTLIAEGASPEKIAVIPYGAPEVGRTAPPQRSEGPPRFLFVGQGVQRKGLHHLIRAWQLRPRGDARLTIVSYSLDPDIGALVSDPSIEVLGYQEREQLAGLYARSDVFAMPSLLEGFGLVFLEALAQGCHVLGTEKTGLPDLGLDASSATIVLAGDIAALDKSITELIEKGREGAFDREAIAAQAVRWTQADFRRCIADHAAQVLSAKQGKGSYPSFYRSGPRR